MGKKGESKQDPNKELNLHVMRVLMENGILNKVHAGMLTDVAAAVQDSPYDAMKPYKTIKHDTDSEIAAEIVFEFLKRHEMWDTIKCIQTETRSDLKAREPSGIVKQHLSIPGKQNILSSLIEKWNEVTPTAENREVLKNGIAERLGALSGKKRSKGSEQAEVKQEPSPAKPASPKAAKKEPVKKNDEFDSFDEDTPPAKPSPKAVQKPAKKVTTPQDVDDFDVLSSDEPPPPKKQQKKHVSKPADDDFDDFDEPEPQPVKKRTVSAPATKLEQRDSLAMFDNEMAGKEGDDDGWGSDSDGPDTLQASPVKKKPLAKAVAVASESSELMTDFFDEPASPKKDKKGGNGLNTFNPVKANDDLNYNKKKATPSSFTDEDFMDDEEVNPVPQTKKKVAVQPQTTDSDINIDDLSDW